MIRRKRLIAAWAMRTHQHRMVTVFVVAAAQQNMSQIKDWPIPVG
jgi:hypothetical protein